MFMSNTNGQEEESADAKARRLREIGDGTAVYGEVGQNDEQLDVNQPPEDDDA
jgi:hypothetical protein